MNKVYKIKVINSDECYIGSTSLPLEKRLKKHIYDYNEWLENKRRFISSFYLFFTYGIDQCEIELVEDVLEENILEREEYWICNTQNCNIKSAYLGLTKKEYDKQYRKENSEKLKEYDKQYYKDNKEKLDTYKKEYLEKNKEKYREYQRNYQRKYRQKKEPSKEAENRDTQVKCECGGHYTLRNRSTHFKTKKHTKYFFLYYK
jgi:hypothetical protein